MYILIRTTCLIVFFLQLISCEDIKVQDRILIIGDSWGKLMCVFQSFDSVISDDKANFGNTQCLSTTENGSETTDWEQDKYLAKIQKVIETDESIKFIVISLGGNDMLARWNVDSSQSELASIIEEITIRMDNIITFIRKFKPDTKIIISGYDYPNFTKIEGLSGKVLKPYLRLYQKMGKPTPAQLNMIIVNLAKSLINYSLKNKNVFYANFLGMGQSRFGLVDYGVPPNSLSLPGQFPDYYPLEGGDSTLPTSPKALANLSIGKIEIFDAYHLKKSSYKIVAKNIYNLFIRSKETGPDRVGKK